MYKRDDKKMYWRFHVSKVNIVLDITYKGRGINLMNFNIEGLLHGGDYNPEQWLDDPGILEKDIQYMKEAKINTVTLGVFSWAVLEPEEGVLH